MPTFHGLRPKDVETLVKNRLGKRVRGHPDRILIAGEQGWIPPTPDDDLKYAENGDDLRPDQDNLPGDRHYDDDGEIINPQGDYE